MSNRNIMIRDITRVYIGNLCAEVTEEDLKEFFAGFGKINEYSIKEGYGFAVRKLWKDCCCFWAAFP